MKKSFLTLFAELVVIMRQVFDLSEGGRRVALRKFSTHINFLV